jgi:hypothetical protein
MTHPYHGNRHEETKLTRRTSEAPKYVHSYYSSRSLVDWNRCGQAAVATMFDFHGLDPYGLDRPIFDRRDNRYHWRDGEVIDRINESHPPDHFAGLFGTTPRQLSMALESGGLKARISSSPNPERGRVLWEEAKRSMASGSPVIVILDRHKIGGRPFAAHWAVAYRVEDTTVHLANTSGVETASEASFLRAFRCRFMPKPFNHCAILPSMLP